ncbi:MAG: glutamate racemase [Calditrichaeota bacterium]|nr:MAG: glutamate racemase [Calditrichota bacterium]MBL1206784.1 glutamate racemase [Calditrichota bacterium]NOG46612.1 glutamate racemase [Calditrichota bacterium]
MEKQAIGIFDSGIGGLTVLKELRQRLPNERLIYFGDTARIPYGSKSKKLVQQYALEDAAFLLQHNVKMIVVACNTASAMAIDVLTERLKVPVVGVVIPGSVGAIRETKKNVIGVIGTSATISSNAYAQAIKSNSPQEINVYSQACPLLVPLVEEGWLEEQVTVLTLENYLKEILETKVDTLILGCTHYPLLHDTVQKVTGPNVKLVDSGSETARFVENVLIQNNLLNKGAKEDDDLFFVSDIPQKFEEIGSRFLGGPFKNIKRIDFEEFLMSNSDEIKKLIYAV